MRKWVAALAVVVMPAVGGCSDPPPWDGIFGLKSSMTIKELEAFASPSRVEALPDDYEWPAAQVYMASETPDYAPEMRSTPVDSASKPVEYVFNNDGGLCMVWVTENVTEHDTSPMMRHLISRYGSPTRVDRYASTYSLANHDMGEGVDSVMIFEREGYGESYPASYSVRIMYLPDCS